MNMNFTPNEYQMIFTELPEPTFIHLCVESSTHRLTYRHWPMVYFPFYNVPDNVRASSHQVSLPSGRVLSEHSVVAWPLGSRSVSARWLPSGQATLKLVFMCETVREQRMSWCMTETLQSMTPAHTVDFPLTYISACLM